jgi:hypothetical protein
MEVEGFAVKHSPNGITPRHLIEGRWFAATWSSIERKPHATLNEKPSRPTA